MITDDKNYTNKKYAYCTIKNIAVLNKIKSKELHYAPHLSFRNTLPTNCIRMHSAYGWCYNSCIDAVCRECKIK
jgi:hypothetical protein